MKKIKVPEIQTDVEQILKDIGVKIRTHRKSIAKNYEDFAFDHNFNKVTISRIENGKNYTLSTLIKVLHTMNISLEDFFKGIR